MRREFPDAPITGVGAIVVDGQDVLSVLLVRRGQQPLKGEWSLPGGALELGETLQQGIVREVREECGLHVIPSAVVEVFDRIVLDEATGRVRYHYVLVDFLCHPVGGTLVSGDDAEEAVWVSREELGAYGLPAFTLQVIEKAMNLAANSVGRK